MANKVTPFNKLIKAKSITFKFIEIRDGVAKVEIWVKNKFGEFRLYPHLLKIPREHITGDTITIQVGQNFKLKTRVVIS